jgi:NitT/TauT family transport system substrate-binding protein
VKSGLIRLLSMCCGVGAGLASMSTHAETSSLALPSITPSFAAIYVAEDRGLWSKQGLDVTVTQIAGVATMNAVISGSVDFAGSNAVTLIRAAGAGQKMLAIASFQNSPVVELVIRKDVAQTIGFDPKAPLQKRLGLLKGMKIAVDSINSINHAFLRYAAALGGLKADSDLTVAPMQAPSMEAAMVTKSVDGFTVAVPWTTAAIYDGNGVALASVPNGDFPELSPFGGGIVVTRPSLCQEKRPVCMKMGHGLAEAVMFIREHPTETIAILQPHFGQLPKEVLAGAFDIYKNAITIPPSVTEAALKNSEDFEIKGGISTAAERLSSFDGLYTDEFVR